MTEYELRTYQQWLGQPELIKKFSRTYFLPVHEILRLGQAELRWHSKIDIHGASGVGFRIRSSLAAANNSVSPTLRFERNLQSPPQTNLFPTLAED